MEKIKTPDELFVDFFEQRYKFLIDYIGDMADMMATSNVNVHGAKRKTMLPGRKRLLETKEDNVKYIPGVGKVKIVPNYDWDD